MRMACQGIKINRILAFDMIPGISWDYKPQIPLPVAFSYSRSLPVKGNVIFNFSSRSREPKSLSRSSLLPSFQVSEKEEWLMAFRL